MALTRREWWIVGITATASFFIFTTLGRRIMLATMGMGEAEIERAVSKIERKAEKRRVL